MPPITFVLARNSVEFRAACEERGLCPCARPNCPSGQDVRHLRRWDQLRGLGRRAELVVGPWYFEDLTPNAQQLYEDACAVIQENHRRYPLPGEV